MTLAIAAPAQPINYRRSVLRAIAAVAIAPGLAACASKSPRSMDGTRRTTDADRVRALALMRGALDDRVVIGNVFGQYNGVVDAAVEPLFGLVGATFSRYRSLPTGGFAIVSFEQAYYTELDGSRVLDEMVNPYTGLKVRVPVWIGEPMIQFVGADLSFRPAKPLPPRVQVAQSVMQVDAGPHEVVFVERLSVDLASGERRSGEGRGRYGEIVTMRAPLAAIQARDAVQVGCRTSFTSVLAWRDWLGMGDRPGHLMGHGAGAYGIAAGELPSLFVHETRRRRPEALANPERILAPAMRELDALLAKQ